MLLNPLLIQGVYQAGSIYACLFWSLHKPLGVQKLKEGEPCRVFPLTARDKEDERHILWDTLNLHWAVAADCFSAEQESECDVTPVHVALIWITVTIHSALPSISHHKNHAAR